MSLPLMFQLAKTPDEPSRLFCPSFSILKMLLLPDGRIIAPSGCGRGVQTQGENSDDSTGVLPTMRLAVAVTATPPPTWGMRTLNDALPKALVATLTLPM